MIPKRSVIDGVTHPLTIQWRMGVGSRQRNPACAHQNFGNVDEQLCELTSALYGSLTTLSSLFCDTSNRQNPRHERVLEVDPAIEGLRP